MGWHAWMGSLVLGLLLPVAAVAQDEGAFELAEDIDWESEPEVWNRLERKVVQDRSLIEALSVDLPDVWQGLPVGKTVPVGLVQRGMGLGGGGFADGLGGLGIGSARDGGGAVGPPSQGLATLRRKTEGRLRVSRWGRDWGHWMGPPVRVGSVSVESLVDAAEARVGTLTYCYSRIQHREPSVKGEVHVRLVIALNGQVIESDLLSSTLDHPEVEACLLRQFKRLELPIQEGMSVAWFRMNFRPR